MAQISGLEGGVTVTEEMLKVTQALLEELYTIVHNGQATMAQAGLTSATATVPVSLAASVECGHLVRRSSPMLYNTFKSADPAPI